MKTLKVIALAGMMLLSGVVASAQTEGQKSERDRLQREIEILDRQIKDNVSKSSSALTRLSLVQNKVSTRQALIRESDREILSYDNQISSKRKQISKLEAQLDTMSVHYSRLVKSAYKNRDAKIWYMYILASDNLSQGLRRYGYLKDLSKEMNIQAGKIKDSKARLEEEKANLETLRSEAAKLRAARVAELSSLKSEETQVKQLTTQLNKEKTKYQKELNEKKKQAEALEKEIRKMIGKKDAAPVDYKLAEEFSANKGKLPWPAEGPIVAKFGKQYHQVFKSLQLPSNNGISIAVPKDSEVKVVFDGVVAQITILPGYHQCILVQHGNFYTLYAKMNKVNVKAGQRVSTGDVLGTVDTIGGETVFHFEIWNEKTTPQNPETWLRPR